MKKQTIGFAFYKGRWMEVVEIDWSRFEMHGLITIGFYDGLLLWRAFIPPVICCNGDDMLTFQTAEELDLKDGWGWMFPKFVR